MTQRGSPRAIACPTCKALSGRVCRGTEAGTFHPARVQVAARTFPRNQELQDMAKKTAKNAAKKAAAKKTAKKTTAAKARGPSPFAGETPKAALALMVPHKAIRPSELNPRKVVDGDALAELAESIIAEGVLQALLVRPAGKNRYEIINGERRWRAVDAAINAKRLPADYELPVRVRECSDAELVELAAAENMARQDMTPLEEADVIAAMRKFHNDDAEIARRLGIPERTLYRRVALLKLCPDLREALAADKITQQQAAAFALGSAKAQKEHWGAILDDLQDEGEKANAAETWNGRVDTIKEAMTESLIPVDRVLFDLDLYKGEILEDGEQRYLVDTTQARKLQTAAVKARVAELKKQWSWCKRIESWERRDYAKTRKDDPKAGAVYFIDHENQLTVVAPVLSAENTKKAERQKTKEQKEERDEAGERREELVTKLFDILVEQPVLVMARQIAGDCTSNDWHWATTEAEKKRVDVILTALFDTFGKAIGAKKAEQMGDKLMDGDEDEIEAKIIAALVDKPLNELARLYALISADSFASRMVSHKGELDDQGMQIAQRYLPGFEPAGLQQAAE